MNSFDISVTASSFLGFCEKFSLPYFGGRGKGDNKSPTMK